MPLYEYRCTNCDYSFEKIQSFSAEPETVCPKCQGVLIRPVTAPALQFKGAGWYINDYAAKGSAKSSDAVMPPATSASEAKPATTESSSPTPTPVPASAPSTGTTT